MHLLPRLSLIIAVVVLCISPLFVETVNGYVGTQNIVNVNVSSIDIQAAKPYVEIGSFQFIAVVDGPKNFTWLWPSSSEDTFEFRSEEAQPLRAIHGNETVIDAYVVDWAPSYSFSPRWFLVPVDETTYRTGFMLAFTTNVTFTSPFLNLDLTSNSLADQWTYSKSYQRFDYPPDNGTLLSWGLHPETFNRFETMNRYQTFYLYEFTLSRTSTFVDRIYLI